MDRYLVISSDCHAGLPPERYRDYLDAKYRPAFDQALPIQLQMTREAAKLFLVDESTRQWRKGRERALTGAWDHERARARARRRRHRRRGDLPGRHHRDEHAALRRGPLAADGERGARAPVGGRARPQPLDGGALPDGARAARGRRHRAGALGRRRGRARAALGARETACAARCSPAPGASSRPTTIRSTTRSGPPARSSGSCSTSTRGAAPIEDYFGALPAARGAPSCPGAVGIYISEVVWYCVRPLTFLIWGGVFERFPRLARRDHRGHQHLGARVPGAPGLPLRPRTTSRAKLGDYRSHLSMRPSDYFRRNVFLGASCMPRREVELRHAIGIGEPDVGQRLSRIPRAPGPRRAHRCSRRFRGVPEAELDGAARRQRRARLRLRRGEARAARGAHRPREGALPRLGASPWPASAT